jgi:hypothetical protein
MTTIGSFSIGARGNGRILSRFFTGHNGEVVNVFFQGPVPGDMVSVGLDPTAARRLAAELIAQANRVEQFNASPAAQS